MTYRTRPCAHCNKTRHIPSGSTLCRACRTKHRAAMASRLARRYDTARGELDTLIHTALKHADATAPPGQYADTLTHALHDLGLHAHRL